MTALDVVFRYHGSLGANQMSAVNQLHDVYGIRCILFNQQEHTVRVEYDASRLTEEIVAGLLRQAGIDLQGKVTLAS